MHTVSFQNQLNYGQIGEGCIANWLKGRGWNILPIYEKEIDNGKGPRLFVPHGQVVAPDLLVFKSEKVNWIEAKRKSVFSWHRKTRKWVTGIDIHHYEEYQRVLEISKWPVWLFFLHEKDRVQGRNEPFPCNTGLFAQDLSILVNCENHRHKNHGRTGMVYWAEGSLRKFATIEQVLSKPEIVLGRHIKDALKFKGKAIQ